MHPKDSAMVCFIEHLGTMRIAFCLLCVRPERHQMSFYSQLTRYGIDVFALADCNQRPYDVPDEVSLVQIEDQECKENGFFSFNTHLRKKPLCSAWDKGLFFFSRRLTEYDYVWMVEEDVFVAHVSSLLSIQVCYPSHDLICGKGELIQSDTALKGHKWMHWHKLPKLLRSPPYVSAMCCASRLSKRLLSCINSFVVEYCKMIPADLDVSNVRRLNKVIGSPFLEFSLPMLAAHNKLSIARPANIRDTVVAPAVVDYAVDDVKHYDPAYIYHPVKDHALQHLLRKQLLESSSLFM